MIVIERDGRVIVISGWRAWVIGAVAVVATTIVLGAVAFLVLGIAVSVVALLMILMPAIAIVALLGSFLRLRRR
jgi:hypothetical protein